MSLLFRIVGIVALCCMLTGCLNQEDWEYAWSRGQPAGVSDLIQRSSDNLASSITSHGPAREKFSGLAVSTSKALQSALGSIGSGSNSGSLGELSNQLKSARSSFMAMEGLVSIGSRAAFSELSGQLRNFAAKAKEGQSISPKAFGLFHARTQFFLARELMVPPPNFG